MTNTPVVQLLYSEVPGVYGGNERFAEQLCAGLNGAGVKAEIFTMPFSWNPKELLIQEALKWRNYKPEADLVIPMKFPAYFCQHPNKVPLLSHQFRQLYDFHGSQMSGFSNNLPDSALRQQIVDIDTTALKESLSIYTISRNTLNRLRRYNGLDGKVIYPPPINDQMLIPGDYGDYIFSAGRLEEYKRFDLLLHAVAKTRQTVQVKIAGTGSQAEALKALAIDLGIMDRVEFLGFVSDIELVELYRNSLAVHYAPLDEDYGLIAVEAMKCAKAVITATDSGGPLEHIRHTENGFIMDPEAEAQAKAMDELWENPQIAKRLGSQGQRDVSYITWQTIIDELLKWL